MISGADARLVYPIEDGKKLFSCSDSKKIRQLSRQFRFKTFSLIHVHFQGNFMPGDHSINESFRHCSPNIL